MSKGLVGEAVVTTTSPNITVAPTPVRQTNNVADAIVVMHTGAAISIEPDPVPTK